MQFGLFYEWPNPSSRNWKTLFEEGVEQIQYSEEMKNIEHESTNFHPIGLIIEDNGAPVDWHLSHAKLDDKYQSRDNILFSQAISFFFEVEFGNITVDGWD